MILNIDDDEAGRYAVSRSLRRAGFDVVDADTGLKGLEAASENLPDVILLDVRLPDIDGFEVCRRIRENPRLAAIVVIQVSASYLDTPSRVRGLETGADAYLTKPAETAVLIATVRSLLRFRQAENQVRESARQWQSTFDALSDGVALIDLEGKVRQANAAFLKYAGQESGEQRKVVARLLPAAIQSGKRQSEERLVESSYFAIALDPVKDEAGRCTGAVGVVRDVTEKRQFEQHVQQTARLESLGVLAGGIAHDFNNLLTGILGNASLILESFAEGAPEREMLNGVIAASESAAALTHQILAYAGQGHYQLAAVDVSAIARQSLAFARRIVSKKVSLIDDIATPLPVIEADASQIQQVIMNLLINGSESFVESRSGTVRVTTRVEALTEEFFAPSETSKPGEYVALVVADDGCGMDQETQNHIFEPFFTTKFTGRGLGLSAVHGILRRHKAVLRLRSAVGIGTTFSLYFPACRSNAPKCHPGANGGATADGAGTILVVDDEISIREVARVALARRGYEVLLAENGAVGVELLRKHHTSVRLVLLDYMMPVMDGEEALRAMRQISARVPVIVASGYSRDLAPDRFERELTTGFLQKPFTSGQLCDAVSAVLKNSA